MVSVTRLEPISDPLAGLLGPPEMYSEHSLCAAATDGWASETASAPAKAHATASGHAVLLPLLVLIIVHLP